MLSWHFWFKVPTGGGSKLSVANCLIFISSGIYMYFAVLLQASEDLEGMETLAQMAASQNEVSAADGETYIEKYIKGVSAVESILTLDRLRQVSKKHFCSEMQIFMHMQQKEKLSFKVMLITSNKC